MLSKPELVKKFRPRDLAREICVSSARIAPVLISVIHDYALKSGITLEAEYEGENLPAAMSLVTSTGGVTLIPLYARNMPDAQCGGSGSGRPDSMHPCRSG